jgi:hypothetical protein
MHGCLFHADCPYPSSNTALQGAADTTPRFQVNLANATLGGRVGCQFGLTASVKLIDFFINVCFFWEYKNSHLHYALHGTVMPFSGPCSSCNLARICCSPLGILYGMHSHMCQLQPTSPLASLRRMWNVECNGSNMVAGDSPGECNCIVGFIDVDTDFEGAFCVPSAIPYQIRVVLRSLHPRTSCHTHCFRTSAST